MSILAHAVIETDIKNEIGEEFHKILAPRERKMTKKEFNEKIFSSFQVSKEETYYYFEKDLFKKAFKYLCSDEKFFTESQCLTSDISLCNTDPTDYLIKRLKYIGSNKINTQDISIRNRNISFFEQICSFEIEESKKFLVIDVDSLKKFSFVLSFYYGKVMLPEKVYISDFNNIINNFNKVKRKCSFIMGTGINQIGVSVYLERHQMNVAAVTENGSYTLIDPKEIKFQKVVYSIQ